MKTTITWQKLKEKVERALEEEGIPHDKAKIQCIDIHEDRDDKSLSVWFDGGMLCVACNN